MVGSRLLQQRRKSMSKLLSAFSVAALFYGDCVFGMDYDENELYENPEKDMKSESGDKQKPMSRRLERQKKESQKDITQTLSIDGRKMPILDETYLKSNAIKDTEGQLFSTKDPEPEEYDNNIKGIIHSLEINSEQETKIKAIMNGYRPAPNNNISWEEIAQIIEQRIFIYCCREGFIYKIYEYGTQFSTKRSQRICFFGHMPTGSYRKLRKAVSIDGKIIPVIYCPPKFVKTFEQDIKNQLFMRIDKGWTWKNYNFNCSINSLELTNEENELIPQNVRAYANKYQGVYPDKTEYWETIAKAIHQRILVYEYQNGFIQGFYEYGSQFLINGTKRVCLEEMHYQKLLNININSKENHSEKINSDSDNMDWEPTPSISILKQQEIQQLNQKLKTEKTKPTFTFGGQDPYKSIKKPLKMRSDGQVQDTNLLKKR